MNLIVKDKNTVKVKVTENEDIAQVNGTSTDNTTENSPVDCKIKSNGKEAVNATKPKETKNSLKLLNTTDVASKLAETQNTDVDCKLIDVGNNNTEAAVDTKLIQNGSASEDLKETGNKSSADSKSTTETENTAIDSKSTADNTVKSLKRKNENEEEAKIRKKRSFDIRGKTPLQLIHDLFGSTAFEFKGSAKNPPFKAEANINGVVFEGVGKSKALAKNDIAVKALQQLEGIPPLGQDERVYSDSYVGIEQNNTTPPPVLDNHIGLESKCKPLANGEVHAVYSEEKAVDSEEKAVDSEEKAVDSEEKAVDSEDKAVDEEQAVNSEVDPIPQLFRTVSSKVQTVDSEPPKFSPQFPPVDKEAARDFPTKTFHFLWPKAQLSWTDSEEYGVENRFKVQVEISNRTFVGEGRSKKAAKTNLAKSVLSYTHKIHYQGDKINNGIVGGGTQQTENSCEATWKTELSHTAGSIGVDLESPQQESSNSADKELNDSYMTTSTCNNTSYNTSYDASFSLSQETTCIDSGVFKTHYCPICSELMFNEYSPMILTPCGHSYCFSCVARVTSCPLCGCEISSIEENRTLRKIITTFHNKMEDTMTEEEEAEEEWGHEIESDDDCCGSSVAGSSSGGFISGLREEAGNIVDKMEDLTQCIVDNRNYINYILEVADELRGRVGELQGKLYNFDRTGEYENENENEVEVEVEAEVGTASDLDLET